MLLFASWNYCMCAKGMELPMSYNSIWFRICLLLSWLPLVTFIDTGFPQGRQQGWGCGVGTTEGQADEGLCMIPCTGGMAVLSLSSCPWPGAGAGQGNKAQEDCPVEIRGLKEGPSQHFLKCSVSAHSVQSTFPVGQYQPQLLRSSESNTNVVAQEIKSWSVHIKVILPSVYSFFILTLNTSMIHFFKKTHS